MFTHKELLLFEELKQNENYQFIRMTDDYFEFRSRNSGHCWIIKKEPGSFELRCPYTIYHKHKTSDYYHRHWQTYSVKKCAESIKEHDDYVMRERPLFKNNKHRNTPKYGV